MSSSKCTKDFHVGYRDEVWETFDVEDLVNRADLTYAGTNRSEWWLIVMRNADSFQSLLPLLLLLLCAQLYQVSRSRKAAFEEFFILDE